MDGSEARTTILVRLIERLRGGDRAARDEIVRIFEERLGHLARKMFRKYPSVARWVEVEDVLQGAMMRLLRALETVRPESTRAFFGLAAQQMRRELLDLRRYFRGDRCPAPAAGSRAEPADPGEGDADFERWCRFHEEVAGLPERDREVVELVYYHGWSKREVAELFDVDERTVRRWWEAALVRLHGALNEADRDDGRP